MYNSKKEQCPQCAGHGRDTRKDNLHRYPDGHAHCFACQYHEWNRDGSTAGNMPNEMELERLRATPDIQLPKDATVAIDFVALEWLTKYEIETKEVVKYGMLWSPAKKMLIFPFYADTDEIGHPTGKLMGWQGRSFNSNYDMKYYKVGGFTDFFNILNLHNGRGSDIIIVEDFLSAIKIARNYTSMALLGSNLSTQRMKLLEGFAEDLTFWMDEDKADKGLELARTGSMLGFRTKYIITKHDPKEYNDDQIKETVESHL